MTPIEKLRHLIHLSLVPAILSCANVAAQTHHDVGTLSADNETFVWTPAPGDSGTARPLRGDHDDLGLPVEDRDALSEVFSREGLVTSAGTVPPANMIVTFKNVVTDRADIVFSASDSAALRSDLTWVLDSSFEQPAGEFVPGDLVVFHGTVTVNGEVGGNVLVVDGDVVVREGATVRGAVVVIGGILRQRGDGKIYGPVFAPGGHRRPRLSVTRAWEFENEGVRWSPSFSYDRVDGARLGGNVAYQKSAYAPRLAVYAGYALASETWQYRFRIEQQLLRSVDVRLHGSVFRLTETDDERWVGRSANTVYALFAGSDYRDYYGADGGELGVMYKYRERGILSLIYRNTDYRRLEAERGLWHLFNPNHLFRENFSTLPPDEFARLEIDRFEERTSAIHFSLGVEPRESMEHPSRFDAAVKAETEIAGDWLGGAFDYDRWQFSAMGEWNSERTHRITARLWYGKGRRNLPPNKFFYLGGVGSLPGYSQKELVGNQAMLASLEYRFDYWPDQAYKAGLILFFDIGRATFDDDFLDLAEFKSDIGVGLGLGDGLRLNVAKGLDRTDRDIRVSLSFGRKR